LHCIDLTVYLTTRHIRPSHRAYHSQSRPSGCHSHSPCVSQPISSEWSSQSLTMRITVDLVQVVVTVTHHAYHSRSRLSDLVRVVVTVTHRAYHSRSRPSGRHSYSPCVSQSISSEWSSQLLTMRITVDLV